MQSTTMEIPASQLEQSNAIETHLLKHQSAFLAFVRRRVADPELAADVLQDSFLKALRASDALRGDEKIVAWFYRILRRTIIDLYRRRAVEKRVLDQIELEGKGIISQPDEKAVCRCLELLLPTLAPQYAGLIRELDLGGVEPERMAKRLGITANNLKVRLHRARRQLRTRLLQTCQVCAKHGCLNCDCSEECVREVQQRRRIRTSGRQRARG